MRTIIIKTVTSTLEGSILPAKTEIFGTEISNIITITMNQIIAMTLVLVGETMNLKNFFVIMCICIDLILCK
jgi:hypothetical protein